MATPIHLAYIFIAYILLALYVQFSRAETWKDGTLYALDGSGFDAFNADASLWTFSSQADGSSKVSFCNNIYLLGGYNILGLPNGGVQTGQYFYRQFSGGALASAHNAINILLTFQAIDSWDAADYYQIQFDTNPPIVGHHFIYTGANTMNLCGNLAQLDQPPMKLKIIIPHSASTLNITIISKMDQPTSDESFGIRDLFITPYMAETAPTTSTLCGVAQITLTELICPCSTPKFYQDPPDSGTCYPCHYDCATCTGPYDYQCTACRGGKYLDGSRCYNCSSSCAQCFGPNNNQCISCYEGDFLALDKYCVKPCDYPLNQTTNTTMQYCETNCYPNPTRWDQSCVDSANPDPCVYPLNLVNKSSVFPVCEYICDVFEFLYWDQDCQLSCDFPLVNVTKFSRQFCEFPCNTSPNTILYWDGICRSSCNFPLVPRTFKGKAFCDYPCTTSQYLYWNGSCIDTCETPLKVRIDPDTGVVYCDFPCAVTEVAYWDGSCDSTCPAPPILKSEGSPMVRYYCTYQCKLDEFLYWDGSCSNACPPPLKYQYFKGRSFCLYPCQSNKYLFNDGTCLHTCDSPFTIRIEGGYKFCDLNCPDLQYLYWNSTCSDSCDSPLLPRETSYGRFCDFPCGNQADFLYWDGTCSSSCPLPYTQNTVGVIPRKFCVYPCSTSEYLYYNGTCGGSCSAPFSIRVQDGLQYCDYPCTGIAPSVYLLWDGTCVSTCDAPRHVRADTALWQFCEFSCASSSMFLYWDGSCSDYCMSPLTQHTEGSGDNIRKFCDYKCNSGEYLNWDGNCSSSCPTPYRAKTEKGKQFCDSPCSSVFEYYYPSDNGCRKECEYPYRIDNGSTYQTCLSPIVVEQEGWFVSSILTAPPDNEVTFSAVVKMTQHLRFLDIQMSPRLQLLAASRGRPIFSLKTGILMPQDMQEDFANTALPAAFQTFGLHPSFLVNFWGDLISIFIVIVAALVTIILDKTSHMYKFLVWQEITKILKYLFKWNCVIILFSTLLEDVILFSSIQFRTAQLASGSQETFLSIFVCCIIFILAVVYLGGISYLVYQSYRITTQAPKRVTSNRLEKFQAKTSEIQVLFKGFKTDEFYKHSFYVIYILRLCLSTIIAAYLFAYPVAQMVIQIIINIGMIVFLLLVKPLEKKINMIQLLVSEAIALIINVCLLTLTTIDFTGTEKNDSIIYLGDTIIIACYAMNISTVVFLVIKLMQEASAIRKANPKESTLLSKVAYLQLLAIPLQQCGMGFEELIDKRSYLTAKVTPRIEKAVVTSQNIVMTTELSPPRFVPLKGNIQNEGVREITLSDNDAVHRSTIYSQQDSYRDLLDGSVSQRKFLHFGETIPKKKRMNMESLRLEESLANKGQVVNTTRMLYKPSFVRSVSKDDILNTMGNESNIKDNSDSSQFWTPDPFKKNPDM